LALRHALDHAFRRCLKIQVLGYQPVDKRGQFKVPEAFPPSDIDRGLDRPAGHAFVIGRRPPWRFLHFGALVVGPNDAAGQSDG
jgi:hypothetical protein